MEFVAVQRNDIYQSAGNHDPKINNHHSRCLEKLESHMTVLLPPSGYRVRLRQIRDGLELPPITGDNNYDPSYQEYRRFRNLVHVLRVSIFKHLVLSRSACMRLCRHEFLKHTYMSTTNL
jgi:hypothetical protein